MKGFFIRATRVTPSVYFDLGKSLLDIRGKSSPENPLTFYKHINDTIDKFGFSDKDRMTINVALEYFNTSSSKCIYIIFKKLHDLKIEQGKIIKINWYYEEEDADMLEAGEDLSSFVDCDFNYVEIPEIKILGEMKEESNEA